MTMPQIITVDPLRTDSGRHGLPFGQIAPTETRSRITRPIWTFPAAKIMTGILISSVMIGMAIALTPKQSAFSGFRPRHSKYKQYFF